MAPRVNFKSGGSTRSNLHARFKDDEEERLDGGQQAAQDPGYEEQDTDPIGTSLDLLGLGGGTNYLNDARNQQPTNAVWLEPGPLLKENLPDKQPGTHTPVPASSSYSNLAATQTPESPAPAAAIAPKPDSSLELRRAPESKPAPDARYGLGNIDLTDRNTGLFDEHGDLMTVRSMSFEEDGTEILVPTVVKENGVWRELTNQEAIDWYHRTGEYLGKFKTREEADAYANLLHEQQAEMYANVPVPDSAQEQRERWQAAAAYQDEQDALREGTRGDEQYRQQVAENIDLADQMGLTGDQREAYLAASEEEAWKAYQHRAANDPELVSSTIASWFEKPEINDWEGRQALVDELKGLGVTYEDWVADPEEAARRQERREEVIRLLREGDAAAGNGPMDYTFEDRANSVVTGTGEAIGSSLVNAAGNVAAVAELEYADRPSYEQGVYAHNGRTYGTGSPLDAYLDEQKVALDAAKAREREEAARLYREAHGDGSQPISERLWAMADKLGEASAEDLTRAKGGLSKFGQAGVDISENLLEMGFDSIFGSASLVSMAARTFGSSSRTARLDGASLGEQWAYGLSNAAVETFTEKFADGVASVYGAGAADDIVERVVGRLAETDAGRSFLRIAIEANGEGMEELVSGALGPLMDRIYKDESLKELYSQLDPAELVYEYMLGCAIGLVGGGASVVTGQNAAKNEELRAQDAANAQAALADEVLASARNTRGEMRAETREQEDEARRAAAAESASAAPAGESLAGDPSSVAAATPSPQGEGREGAPSLAGTNTAVPDGGGNAGDHVELRRRADTVAEQMHIPLTEAEAEAVTAYVESEGEVNNGLSDEALLVADELRRREAAIRSFFAQNREVTDSGTGTPGTAAPAATQESETPAPAGTPSLAGESRAVPDGGDRAEPVISAMTPGAQQNDATAQESAGGTDTGASPATERTGESEALNSGIQSGEAGSAGGSTLQEQGSGGTIGTKAQPKLSANAAATDFRTKTGVGRQAETRKTVGSLAESLQTEGRVTEEIWSEAKAAAEKMLDESEDASFAEDGTAYKEMRDYLKKTGLKPSDELRGDSADYDAWRKSLYGRITFRNDGMAIDSAYQELADMFGEGLFPSDIMGQRDQVDRILWALEAVRPKQVTVAQTAGENYDQVLEETTRQLLTAAGQVAGLDLGEITAPVAARDDAAILEAAIEDMMWIIELEDKGRSEPVTREEALQALRDYGLIDENGHVIAPGEESDNGHPQDDYSEEFEEDTDGPEADGTHQEGIPDQVAEGDAETGAAGDERAGAGEVHQGDSDSALREDGQAAGGPAEETEGGVNAETTETTTGTTAETTVGAESTSTEEMAGRVATAAEQMGISLSQEEAAAAAAHVRGETDGTELSEEARAVAEEVIRRENAIAQWKAKQAVAEHAQVGAEHAETGADNGNGDNSGGIGGPPAPGGTNDLTGNGGDGGGPRLPGHTEPGRGRRSQTESHTEQSVAGALGGQQNPLYYIPTSERQTLTEAVNRVNADMNGEMQHLMDNEGWSAADIDTALTIYGLLQADGVRRGDFSAALEWGRVIQTRGTRTAQALQAFAKWTRSGRAQSQEGANQINENENLPQEMRDRITNDLMNFGEEFDNLQEGDLEGLRDLIERLSRYRGTGTFAPRNFRRLLNREMNEDYLREYALRQLIAIPADYNNRPSLGEQMKTWQVQSQLTRIGTFLRNIGGNQVFGTQDLLAQNAFGVAIDSLIGHFTGHREVRLERGWLSSRAREAAGEALRRSTLEVSGDINMRGDTNRYGTTSNRTNKMIGGPFQRFMSRWEQLLSYSLTTSDATFRGKLEGSTLESLAGEVEAGRLTQEEAEQIARERADYRLFQNHGIAYDLSKGAHDVLNRVGIGGERRGVMREGGFGLGDLVNPYPGVPANLAVKVLEYSPANIIKGGVELAQVLTAARNGELTAGQQSQAVMDIARGLSGTPAIALLAALFRTGLLKNGDDEDDPDAAAQSRAEGRSGVQWNLSATIRAGEGGSNEWKDGDNLLSVSWLEPLNAYLAIASRVADEEEDHGLAAMTSNYLEGAVQSVLDMPVMGNIANIVDTARYSTAEGVWGKVGDVAAQAAGDAVSGMLPAPVGQLARTIDPHYRDTTGDSRVDTSINTFLNSLPWARENLPQKTDVFGNPKDYASDPLQRFLNNFILPGSVNELHQTEVSARTEAVYKATGEAAVYPDRNGPRSITIEGEKIGLSAAERRSYHETAGQETERLYSEFMSSSAWENMSDAQRAAIMKGLKEFANDTAKRQYAEEHGMEYSSDWDDEARMADPVSYLAARTSFKDAEKARDYDAIDEFMEGWYGLPRETRAKLESENTVYEALLGASRKGVSSEEYFQVSGAVKAHTDAAGSTKGVEKFRGFVNSGADLETMDALAESYLGSQAYGMYKAGRSSGLKPDQVLAIWEKADGSAGKAADGSISQQELYNALNNYRDAKGRPLTEAQKNAIWNSREWSKTFSEYKPK